MLVACLSTLSLAVAVGTIVPAPSDDAATDPHAPRLGDASVPEPTEDPAPPVDEGSVVEPDAPAADPRAPSAVDDEPEAGPDPAIDPPPAAAPPGATVPGPSPPDDDDDEGDDPFGDDADDEPWPDAGPAPAAAEAEPLPDYDPLRDSPQALRARHWVRTGIGTMSAGGALLVGAIIMGASDPCNLDAGNSCQPKARNRAALVMGIPAVVLLAGGATALGVGRHRRKQLAVDLQAGRQGFGVALRGRF